MFAAPAKWSLRTAQNMQGLGQAMIRATTFLAGETVSAAGGEGEAAGSGDGRQEGGDGGRV